jgi:AraC family transcriptional activator of pobA
MPNPAEAGIRVYDLYGDPLLDPVPGFLHAERIGARAPLHGWTIASHRHPELSQAFLFTARGGVISLEGREIPFEAPWLLWSPAGHVHGFTFRPGTDGYVVTVASDFLAGALARETSRDLQQVAERALATALPAAEQTASALERSFAAILREIGLAERGGRAAVAAHLDLVFVALARNGAAVAEMPPDDRHAALFRAFRKLVEQHYRQQWSVADYADALGITRDRLHDICRRAAGRPAVDVIQDRLVIEAKRALIYSSLSVAEIAFDLGFRDPAYFSRFFSRRTGCAPSVFRHAA